MATKFYICRHCGNVIEKVVDSRVPVVCCGEKMEELIPNTVDASGEKHVPVVKWIDDHTIKVEVGSVAHPMLEEHHIAFIYVETEHGGIRVNLSDKPEAVIPSNTVFDLSKPISLPKHSVAAIKVKTK